MFRFIGFIPPATLSVGKKTLPFKLRSANLSLQTDGKANRAFSKQNQRIYSRFSFRRQTLPFKLRSADLSLQTSGKANRAFSKQISAFTAGFLSGKANYTFS